MHFPHESVEPSVILCFGQQFPHYTLPSANCGSPSFPAKCYNFDVRALIVISRGTWDTNSRHFNAVSFPSAHTPGDKLHCTICLKFSSTTAEMAGKIASLLTQCCQHVHFFWDHPRMFYLEDRISQPVLRLGWTIRMVRFPAKAKDFSHLRNIETNFGVPHWGIRAALEVPHYGIRAALRCTNGAYMQLWGAPPGDTYLELTPSGRRSGR